MDQQLSAGESLLPKSLENEAPANNHSNSNEEDGTTTDHDFHPDLSSESSDAATLEQRRAYKIERQVLCYFFFMKCEFLLQNGTLLFTYALGQGASMTKKY